MPSPKRQAVICHKIAALSYLLAEALDELNPEVADSNPFKSNVMPWLISAMKLSVMSLSTRNSLLYISSKHEYSSGYCDKKKLC
jgi:hypothetical protein